MWPLYILAGLTGFGRGLAESKAVAEDIAAARELRERERERFKFEKEKNLLDLATKFLSAGMPSEEVHKTLEQTFGSTIPREFTKGIEQLLKSEKLLKFREQASELIKEYKPETTEELQKLAPFLKDIASSLGLTEKDAMGFIERYPTELVGEPPVKRLLLPRATETEFIKTVVDIYKADKTGRLIQAVAPYLSKIYPTEMAGFDISKVAISDVGRFTVQDIPLSEGRIATVITDNQTGTTKTVISKTPEASFKEWKKRKDYSMKVAKDLIDYRDKLARRRSEEDLKNALKTIDNFYSNAMQQAKDLGDYKKAEELNKKWFKNRKEVSKTRSIPDTVIEDILGLGEEPIAEEKPVEIITEDIIDAIRDALGLEK